MKLNWKGGDGNLVCVTDDGAVYSIQTIRGPEFILLALAPDGVTRLGGLGFLGTSFDNIDEAKARAQEIEDER